MVDLEFNFIGVETVDFDRAFRFYTDAVGIEPAASTPSDSWAMLVSGMEDSPVSGARGLRCELFERDGEPPDERHWGYRQNLRPSIQVEDLPAVRSTLQNRGVSYIDDIVETAWGRRFEFSAPEGIRWSLASAPDFPAGEDLETPHVGWAELKVENRNRQEEFYTQIMGLSVGERYGSRVRLEQGAGDPQLFLEPGGERVSAEGAGDSPFIGHPVWMSFETPDVTESSARLNSHDVPVLREITSHDWAGKDIVIEDPEGNPIQVVEYLDR